MSLFFSLSITCPSCGSLVDFETVFSINVGGRPDLREAILDRSLQYEPCPKCAKKFRLDPEFTYLDVARGQMIAAFPVAKLSQWPELEAQARAAFALSYGEKASAAARAIGAGLKPRVVFGWAALREKLVIDDLKLDDVAVELTKAAMLRGLESPPFDLDTELRLVGAQADELTIAWIRPANEETVEVLRVPRSLYDEVSAHPDDWQELRRTLGEGPFVDLGRILAVPQVPA